MTTEQYFEAIAAIFASMEKEEDKHERHCSIAVYDENDFDPALFLNANIH